MISGSKKCAARHLSKLSPAADTTDEPSRLQAPGRIAMIRVLALVTALGAVSACAHGAAPPVGSVGITLDDARIAAAVRSALLADPDLGLRAITVDVERGTVSLSGVVRTEEEVERAATVTRRAAGVREVKSDIKVGS